jgi:hypothetical protein
VSERGVLVARLRAIARLVSTHVLSERDDAQVVGLLRGIAFRLAEIDAGL